MSYYSDLDEDLGVDFEVAEHQREYEYELRRKRTVENRRIRNEVQKQLKAAGLEKPKSKPRGAMTDVKCLCCGKTFSARVADRKRGWARYCSKSCKASMQRAF